MALCLAGCYSPRSLDRYVEEEVVRVAAIDPTISTQTVAASAQQIKGVAAPASGEAWSLDRTRTLILANEYSRNLQAKRDELNRAGLSLFGVRRDFGLGINGTIGYIFSSSEEGEDDPQHIRATLAAERILPTGGRLNLDAFQQLPNWSLREDEEERYTSQARLRLNQPLLSGAGYEASHENLTQAERNYVYALRNFAVERQVFAITTLREYFNLLGQRKALENARTNYQQFVFLRQRSEALFQVNRAPAIDVLRSQQEELTALNRLTTTEESYQIQIGRFLVALGLPTEWRVELADDIPDMRPVGLDETNAVAMAMQRRPEVMTVRDQLEDARRQWRVARNLFLPRIGLVGAAAWSGDEATRFSDQDFDPSWEGGVQAEIPFDRRDERDAVRNAQLNLDAAVRRHDELIENTRLEVRESFSRLRSFAVSVQIQQKNIEITQKRAVNAFIQFRNGKLSNRDVVEAANDLLNARNAYIAALSDYEIQRLTLLRQIGLLDVARDGSILELEPES